jgi:hypothetical protein
VGTSTPPIFEYDHSAGNCSVTGGYMYRGPSAPSLAGKYLYGDFCSGQIWTLQPGGGGGSWSSTLLMDTTHQISSFGEDEAGDVYVVAYGTSGAVYKFVEDTPATVTPTTTATLTGSPIVSPTNTPANTRTNTPTNTLAPTSTPTRTPTSTPSASRPDLAIDGSAVEEGPGPFAAGQVIHLIQTVRNTGASIPSTTTVRLSDRLPAGSTVPVGGIEGGGATCVVTLPDVVCDHPGLGSGQAFTVRVAVQLPSRIPGRGETVRPDAVGKDATP